MIGYLKGKLIEVGDDTAIIDVQGVGYEILASSNTLGDLEAHLSKDVIVWIHTHVREDALQLFGFHDKDEKNMFMALLKVNGVGPKAAISILSGARSQQVREMIDKGDAKALTQLPKVGKKTAEQIILTLRGKLVSVDSKNHHRGSTQSEIMSALENLGYKRPLIEDFIDTLPADIPLEEGIRRGLQVLSSGFGSRV